MDEALLKKNYEEKIKKCFCEIYKKRSNTEYLKENSEEYKNDKQKFAKYLFEYIKLNYKNNYNQNSYIDIGVELMKFIDQFLRNFKVNEFYGEDGIIHYLNKSIKDIIVKRESEYIDENVKRGINFAEEGKSKNEFNKKIAKVNKLIEYLEKSKKDIYKIETKEWIAKASKVSLSDVIEIIEMKNFSMVELDRSYDEDDESLYEKIPDNRFESIERKVMREQTNSVLSPFIELFEILQLDSRFNFININRLFIKDYSDVEGNEVNENDSEVNKKIFIKKLMTLHLIKDYVDYEINENGKVYPDVLYFYEVLKKYDFADMEILELWKDSIDETEKIKLPKENEIEVQCIQSPKTATTVRKRFLARVEKLEPSGKERLDNLLRFLRHPRWETGKSSLDAYMNFKKDNFIK